MLHLRNLNLIFVPIETTLIWLIDASSQSALPIQLIFHRLKLVLLALQNFAKIFAPILENQCSINNLCETRFISETLITFLPIETVLIWLLHASTQTSLPFQLVFHGLTPVLLTLQNIAVLMQVDYVTHSHSKRRNLQILFDTYLSCCVHDVQWNVISSKFKIMSVDWLWIKKKHSLN